MILTSNFSNNLDYFYQKISYDTACKKILSFRLILAHILKYCVKEFHDCDIQDIAFRYIEGEPQINEVAVHQDYPDRIHSMNSEDKSGSDGDIYYDIKFYAVAPHHGEMIKIILNVEAQNDFYPGYPIVKRAVYYGSRMISSQYGTEFVDSHYEDIKKVYSIWICTNPSKKRENSITRYELTEQNMIGNVKEKKENYDLISVIMICLASEENESNEKLLRLLEVLLSNKRKLQEKKEILEEEYGISMTSGEEKEMKNMCNLSEGIERNGIMKGIKQGIEKGIEKGIEQGIEKGKDLFFVESIQNLMINLHVSINKAMELLNAPQEKREIYRKAVLQKLN